mmetsp:Transcript_5194/g.9891  ORF Transcript_5194/g.9891 Transcript_5194/m.9891 type:complete len:214 (+) Transcript_5194:127-768(+)
MGKKGGGRVVVKQTGPKIQPTNTIKKLLEENESPIVIPTKPDPSVTLYFPPSDTDDISDALNNLPCIWPSNIDSNKGCHQGRRIAKKDCVENPSVLDISEVLSSLGIRHVVQPNKGYPRDVESRWDNPGRVLYDKFQMNHLQVEESSAMSQKRMLCLVASLIEQMPGRKERLLEAERKREEAKKKLREQERMKAILSAKTNVTVGAVKKKGKK